MSRIDPRLLLQGYASGIFPMADSRDASELYWVEPRKRAIIPLDRFHVSRSLRRTVRSGRFTVTRDRDFAAVIAACAGREETWITPSFISAYTRLHTEGHAHSVECWMGEELVGGVYGVAIGGLFAGESMFHRVSNASKVALFHLVEHLRSRQFRLFDIQMLTPVTTQLGGIYVSREEYLGRLAEALKSSVSFLPV